MDVGTMPRKRTSPEEIIHKLHEAEIMNSQGHTAATLMRQSNIHPRR
jgi:hypothetical protein